MRDTRFPSLAIWIIALWLLLGAVSVLSGVLMYATGSILDKEMAMQMSGLGTLHWVMSTAIGVFNLIGVALLLFLKRQALFFIAGAFVITLAQVFALLASGKLQEVFGQPPGLYALPVSLILGVVILVYIWQLTKRGELNSGQ